MTMLYAVVLLGILIFVHESGHFLFAKLMGVKVLKFSLGFGPKVIGKTYGETEYCISAVPLGGYVKMLGEEPGEELPEAEKFRAYSYQPVWKRFVIVFFGPLFNIAFAALIFFLIFINGVPYLLPEIGEVTAQSPALRKGLTKGDSIVEIDGTPIKRWDDMTTIIHTSPGKAIRVKIRRDSSVFDLVITPEKKVVKDVFGQSQEVGLIGIAPSGKTGIERESLVEACVLSVRRTWDISVITVLSIVKLIQRIIPAETIGGPLLIVEMAGKQASHGAMNFFTFMGVISINLGVLNLLPIPILDGGHLMFLAIEFVRKKPIKENVIMVAQRLGLMILVALMVFALYNDILRLITGKMLP